MLADGIFAAVRPVSIFAFHTAPLPVGSFGTRAGGLLPGRDRAQVTISGAGNLQEVAQAAIAAILGVGTVPAGAEFDPAPDDFVLAQVGPPRVESEDRWIVEGSITTASAAARQRARQAIDAAVAGVSRPGVEVTVRHLERAMAGVTNDSALVAQGNASIRGVLGADAVVEIDQVLPAFSEDFGSFQEEVPGVMYFLGVDNAQRGTVGMPHSPDYVADEGAVLVGARAMIAVLLDQLAKR